MAQCPARPQWHSLCLRGLEVQSLEALSQSRALTPVCRSDSVPSSEQKVHCVLLCNGICSYVYALEGLLCMGCRYVGNVGVIAVRRTK